MNAYCEHPRVETRKLVIANGTVQVKDQCLDCGRSVGNPKPHRDFDLDALPAWDIKDLLAETWNMERVRLNCDADDRRLISYLLRLMGVTNWWPPLSDARCLRRCQTHLERMYALGMLYNMENRHRPDVVCGEDTWEILDPWRSFKNEIGPSEMRMVPQVRQGLCTRDFLIWFNGEPALIVEIDGFSTHRNRREADAVRDRHAPLPTIRIREELGNPLTWAEQFLGADWEMNCSHCGWPIEGEHSCPAF